MNHLITAAILFLSLQAFSQETYKYSLSSDMDSVEVKVTVMSSVLVYVNKTELSKSDRAGPFMLRIEFNIEDKWSEEGYTVITGWTRDANYRITLSDIGLELYNEDTEQKYQFYK